MSIEGNSQQREFDAPEDTFVLGLQNVLPLSRSCISEAVPHLIENFQERWLATNLYQPGLVYEKNENKMGMRE